MLTGKDYSAVDKILPELYSHTNLDDLAAYIIQSVATVVGTDATGYTEINPKLNQTRGAMNSAEFESIFLEHKLEFEKYIHQHPLVRHFATSADQTPKKISDFLSLKEWKKTDLYKEFYSHFGLARQMVTTVPANHNLIIGIALNRASRDFCERDRERLKILQPHLVQAYKNMARHARILDRLEVVSETLDAFKIGAMKVDHFGNVLTASELAIHSLGSFFEGFVPDSNVLPEPVSKWLITSVSDPIDTSSPRAPLDLEKKHGRLRITVLRKTKSAGFVLGVERYTRSRNSALLTRLGISDREADVLYWLAQGKKNAEIAIILGISPRTVEKHIQKIFKALNVKSRTKASIMAIDRLTRTPSGTN